MKWCLMSFQTDEYLKKADEIKIYWQDHKKRPDVLSFIEINPTARILIFPSFEFQLWDEDYQWLNEQFILSKQNMAVIINDDQQAFKCKNLNIPFIYGYPARTFMQLNRMYKIGACDAYIDDMLCHSLDSIQTYYPDIHIRVIANSCGWGTLNNIWDGLEGSWFRPEDLWQLNQIYAAEFYTNLGYEGTYEQNQNVKKQEQVLYRIYAEEHEWSGKVDDFIFNIKRKNIMNRLLDEDFQTKRTNCKMKCMETHRCHHCEIHAALAQQTTMEKIKEKEV